MAIVLHIPIPVTDLNISRFWSKVQKSDYCWEWSKPSPSGYGRYAFAGCQFSAHRFSWIITNGPIPEGLKVLHRCDNPACVRPAHLFLGTQAENVQDMIAKGRRNTGPKHRDTSTRPRGDAHHARLHPECLARGERGGKAKLTVAQVLEIRALYATGEISQRVLARRFKVSKPAIRAIIHRQTWTHV